MNKRGKIPLQHSRKHKKSLFIIYMPNFLPSVLYHWPKKSDSGVFSQDIMLLQLWDIQEVMITAHTKNSQWTPNNILVPKQHRRTQTRQTWIKSGLENPALFHPLPPNIDSFKGNQIICWWDEGDRSSAHHAAAAAAAAGGTKQNTLLTFAAEAEQSVGGATCLLREGARHLSLCVKETERKCASTITGENKTAFLSPTCLWPCWRS